MIEYSNCHKLSCYKGVYFGKGHDKLHDGHSFLDEISDHISSNMFYMWMKFIFCQKNYSLGVEH